MKKFKNKLLTGLLATSSLVGTSLAAITLASCGNTPVTPVDPEEAKYFNISGDTLYGFKQGLTAEQKKEICKNGVLKLPAVKVIAENAFNGALGEDAPYASEIVIDSETTTIGKKAFYANRATTISWNGGVKASKCNKIDEEAFAFCTQLESFAFPVRLFVPMDNPQTTGVFKNAFFGCGKLATLDLTTFPQNYYVEQPSWIAKDAFDGISQTGNLIFTKPDLTTTAGEIYMYNCAHLFTRLTVAGLNTAWIECWPGTPKPTPWETQIKFVPYEYLEVEKSGSDYILKGATTDWSEDERNYNAVLVPSRVTGLASNINQFFSKRTRKEATSNKDINAWLFNWTEITSIPAGACADLGCATTNAYWPETLETIGDNAFNGCAWDNDFPNQTNVTSIGVNAFTGSQLTGWAFNSDMTHVGDSAFANAIYVASLDFSAITSKPDTTTVWGTHVFSGTGSGTGSGAQNQATIHDYLSGDTPNKVDQYRIYTDFYNFLDAEQLGVTGDTPKWKVHPEANFEIQELFDFDKANKKIKGWARGAEYGSKGELTKAEVGAILSKIEGFDGTLEIPSKIDNTDVTTIDASAFSGKLPDTVTKLVIPSTVTMIGGNAFENNTELLEVVIPNSVATMGQEAFAGCAKLATIDLTSFEIRSKDWTGPSWTSNNYFANIATAGTIKVHKYKDDTASGEIDQWRLNYPIKSVLTKYNTTLKFESGKWSFGENEDNAVMVKMDSDKVVTGWATGYAGELSNTEKVKLSKDKYNLKKPALVIPAAATGIAEKAFVNSTNESTIPSTLEWFRFEENSSCSTIGARAFLNAPIDWCYLYDANALTSIGEAAFYNTKMTMLTLPVFTNKITFADGVFSHNTLLESIDMSDYVAAPTNWEGSDYLLDTIAESGTIWINDTVDPGVIKAFLATKSDTIRLHINDWEEDF